MGSGSKCLGNNGIKFAKGIVGRFSATNCFLLFLSFLFFRVGVVYIWRNGLFSKRSGYKFVIVGISGMG